MPPPENFGFFEAQISYYQHFEEFSNKKLTLHYSLKIKPADLLGLVKSIPATMLFCNIFFPTKYWGRIYFPQFVSAGIFFVQNSLAGNFVSKSNSKVKWSAP
jgi:hypothetical protein